ncbi:MAG: DUF6054 family protein [Oscillospiraceae bacterium]
MEETFVVSLSPREAIERIDDAVVRGSFTGERLDCYTVGGDAGRECLVAVYEKHFFRVSNRLTLTVVADNFCGETQIHTVSGGGGESVLLRFDWGAADRFSAVVADALAPYRRG